MVHPSRVRKLNTAESGTEGPVVYWMSRDQRVAHNAALAYAAQLAREYNQPLMVVFCLRKKFAHGTERLIDFMLTGLEEVEADLVKKDIPFYFLLGRPEIEIPKFIHEHSVSALVSDFSPLKTNRQWKEHVSERIKIPLYEVDAHNIVPCWAASPKQEFGAYTIRPKIHRLLSEYLQDFPRWNYTPPNLPYIRGGKNADSGSIDADASSGTPPKIGPATLEHKRGEGARGGMDWSHIRSQIEVDTSVPKVDWIVPGEKAAHKMVKHFIAHKLKTYNENRNDPTKDVQSNLSPYLHFGHISSEQVVLEVLNATGLSLAEVLEKHTASTEPLKLSATSFIEELVVRKELSDNFCFYNKFYDSTKGFPAWALKTLNEHRGDVREYTYTLKQLEEASTHDDLWNAAQLEMVKRGKMHGYMRMYWAKKIFEWSKTPEKAVEHAIYLNDKYFLDGRDPNGYTGIAWSVGGVHDRAWFERSIFGKIRYMSYGGAKSKFKIAEYIQKINAL